MVNLQSGRPRQIDVDRSFIVDRKTPGASPHRTRQSGGIASIQEEKVSFSDAITLSCLPAPRPLHQSELTTRLRALNSVLDGEGDLQTRLGRSRLRHNVGNVSDSSREDDGRVASKAGLHSLDLLHRDTRYDRARQARRSAGRNLRRGQNWRKRQGSNHELRTPLHFLTQPGERKRNAMRVCNRRQ